MNFFVSAVLPIYLKEKPESLFMANMSNSFFFNGNMSKFCFDTSRNSKLGEKVTEFSFIVFLPKQSFGLLFIC